jgi:hypothetical protein
MGNVTRPNGGLGSGSNYIIASDGNSLQNLKVTIDVTEDLVSTIGFSFQLNGYSPAGAISAWQQYFFYAQTANWVVDTPNVLYGQVEP